MLRTYPPKFSGTTWLCLELTLLTFWLMSLTSTFLNTVDLAGLMLPLPFSLIESKLPVKQPGPISTYLPRFWSLAMTRWWDAMVETISLLSNGWLRTKCLTELALFTKLVALTMDRNAQLWSTAETATLVKLALFLMNTRSTQLINMETLKEKTTWCKKLLLVDLSPVVLPFLTLLRLLAVMVSTVILLVTRILFMLSPLLDMVFKMARSTGLWETLGALTGVIKDSQRFAEVKITLVLRKTALGLLLRILGLSKKLTRLLLLRRPTLPTIRSFINSLSLLLASRLVKSWRKTS